MKVGTGGNLGLSREYHKKLFGPLFYMMELSFNKSNDVILKTGKISNPAF